MKRTREGNRGGGEPLRNAARLRLIALLILIVLPLRAAQSGSSPLRVGDLFPPVSGQTLTGRMLELPRQAEGKPAVLVFSFSRAAASDARSWNEALAKDSTGAGSVVAYAIIDLESSPRLFRGAAVAGIRTSMPRAVQDRTIVLYKDEALWKERLAVGDASRAYVILLGPGGHLRWRNSSAMSATEFARLKREIDDSLQPLAKRPPTGI